MITEYFKKHDMKDAIKVPFQKNILAHWEDILAEKQCPSRRDFRPQNFTKYLPQIAIVGFNDEQFSPRLTGSAISNMQNHILGTSRFEGDNLRCSNHIIKNILTTCKAIAEPLYFEGQLSNNSAKQLGFSVLALPFSKAPDVNIFDTIILAFNFQKKIMIDAVK